jgi:hypothetical protein
MWAIIPVRWHSTQPGQVWSPAQFSALLDPNITFSLGHYLRRVTFGQADLDYHLFAPVAIDDPRITKPDVEDIYSGAREDRKPLLNVPRAEVTRRERPNWSRFSGIMFWYAQATDLFGGGYPPTCVVDRDSRFDAICHEVLHMFGFAHTSNGVNEYVSPYDIMSAMSYTMGVGPGPAFVRATKAALPTGAVGGTDPMAVVGPLLSPAQLAGTTYWPALESSGLVRTLPENLTRPVRVRLHAVDLAAKVWPTVNGPAVLQTAELGESKERFYFEFRRSAGYDAGFVRANPATALAGGRPPAGVVVHHRGSHGRLDYTGVLPVENEGDLDATFLEYALRFTVRMRGVGPADAWIDVEVNKRAALPTGHAMNLDVHSEDEGRGTGEPVTVRTKPCFAGPEGSYKLRSVYTRSGFRVEATSRGYEKPRYAWRVHGRSIDPTATSMTLSLPVVTPNDSGGWNNQTQTVRLDYRLQANVLQVACEPTQVKDGKTQTVGNFNVTLETLVAESDPGVLKNHYPSREMVTNLHFQTVAYKWDAAYERAEERCRKMLVEVLRKRIPAHGLPPELDPSWGRVREQYRQILATDPALAQSLSTDLARALGRPSSTILAELGGTRLRSPFLPII